MKRTIKWIFIIGGGLIVLAVAALILIPMFVDMNEYKPQIEAQVAKATGRMFTVGDDLRLSLFPWAGLSFSDLHLGNPPGFEEKDFVSVKSFDVRVKLLPLLFKDIQIKRFILNGARIVLETRKTGQVNWKFKEKSFQEASKETPQKMKQAPEIQPKAEFALKGFTVGEFSITDGSIFWIDHAKSERQEISDVALRLQDVSLDQPIRIDFTARLDQQLFSLKGKVGPLGKMPGKGQIPLDLKANVLGQVDVGLQGRVVDPTTRPTFDIKVQILPFSPRKLMTAMGKALPVTPADPKTLQSMGIKAGIKGDTKGVSITNGVMDLDESKLKFSFKADQLSKPRLAFDIDLDRIDLDRYLPPPSQKKAEEKKKTSGTSGHVRKKTDYTPLRKLALNGSLKVGTFKVKKAKVENVYLKIVGKNGIFNLYPLTLSLYKGNMSGKGVLNVKKDTPQTLLKLTLKGVQAGPLFMDVLQKDLIEGVLKADVDLSMSGEAADRIKKTLNGNGDLLFKDGAVKGIDLGGMVHNAKAAFGLAEAGQKTPQTEFSEFQVPFVVRKGIVKTSDTRLFSPLIRLKATGSADLVKEYLDFRVEPKLVATLKGQGDIQERSGLMVPVLVTGNFSSPKFRPDLEGMLKQKMEKSIPDLQQKLMEGATQKGETKGLEDQVKGILKGFGK